MKSFKEFLLESLTPLYKDVVAPTYRRGQQNFIACFYKNKRDRTSANFERFSNKKLSSVIKDLKTILQFDSYIEEIENGNYNWIRIYTTFEDHYEQDGLPVIDMSLDDFFKTYLKLEPIERK